MSDRPALSIRPATEADLRFVRASWFESFRHGGYAPQVAFPTYRAGQSFVIERCLAKGRCYVAFATEVPDEVVSWVCVERALGEKPKESGLLHFVYTKQVYRRLGTAIALARHAFNALAVPPAEHTHDTKVGRSFAARIGTKLNPYLLYL